MIGEKNMVENELIIKIVEFLEKTKNGEYSKFKPRKVRSARMTAHVIDVEEDKLYYSTRTSI
jgi:hypothetical protein